MKQIASNYAYSPATNVVTLAGVNIDADQLLLIVAPQVGRTMYNFASVTGSVVAGTDTRVTLNASTVGLTTTSPLVIFYDDQASAQAVTGTVALDPASLVALENITVTVGSSVALAAGSAQIGSVTVANFPASQTVAGTVTANLPNADTFIKPNGAGGFGDALEAQDDVSAEMCVAVHIQDQSGNVLGAGKDFPVSGTVTANIGQNVAQSTIAGSSEIQPPAAVNIGWRSEELFHGAGLDGGGSPLPVRLYSSGGSASAFGTEENPIFTSSVVTVGKLPNGALTTRFGSVVTANLAAITSAVTNTSRKYLLAQNISAGTVTIGIGFPPTTTQGIQLPAGGGLTFDAFCPTGAVYWLGAVTGAAYTILEG